MSGWSSTALSSCEWASMKPGAKANPVRSISETARKPESSPGRPIAEMRPSASATSPVNSGPPVPSWIRAFRKMVSTSCMPLNTPNPAAAKLAPDPTDHAADPPDPLTWHPHVSGRTAGRGRESSEGTAFRFNHPAAFLSRPGAQITTFLRTFDLLSIRYQLSTK